MSAAAVLFVLLTLFSRMSLDRYRSLMLDTEGLERDRVRLMELLQKERQGDKSVAEEVRRLRGRVAVRLGAEGASNAGPLSVESKDFLRWMAPRLALIGLLRLAVTLMLMIGCVEILMGNAEWSIILKRSIRALPRLAGLLFLLCLLSFLWVPFTGIIAARLLSMSFWIAGSNLQPLMIFCSYLLSLLILPRLLLSPLFLIAGNCTIVDSLHQSIAATRGHWGKILGNMLVISVGCITVSGIMLAFAQRHGFDAPLLSDALSAFLLALSIATCVFFLVHLTETIQENPAMDGGDDPAAPTNAVTSLS